MTTAVLPNETVIEVPIDAVIINPALQPRSGINTNLAKQYQEVCELLPPITVNQKMEIVDGHHRYFAWMAEDYKTIKVQIIETYDELDGLIRAATMNSSHGTQLTPAEKKQTAVNIWLKWNATPEDERRGIDKSGIDETIRGAVAASTRSITEYLRQVKKDSERAERETVFNLWMRCDSNREIEKQTGMAESTIRLWMGMRSSGSAAAAAHTPEPYFEQPEMNEFVDRNRAEFDSEWDIKLYDIWNWSGLPGGQTRHPGNSHWGIVENLIYYYTQPFDIVVDPFGGGGSTVDMCRQRFRRYFVSDINPIPTRASEIRYHDIMDGPPAVPNWDRVKLLYLDPPYWGQLAGDYGDNPNDLSNIGSSDDFHELLTNFILRCVGRMPSGSKVALAYQSNAPEGLLGTRQAGGPCARGWLDPTRFAIGVHSHHLGAVLQRTIQRIAGDVVQEQSRHDGDLADAWYI